MAENSKPEIHLEVCNGFFRIPTEKAIYNITVINQEDSSVTRVVEKIVEVEREAPLAAAAFSAPGADTEEGDEFYKDISNDLYHDIGQLAKSLSATLKDLPAEDRRGKRAELDEAGEKIENAKKQLNDIVTMTEKATMEIMDQVEKVQEQSNGVHDLLSFLKEHKAFVASAPEGEEEASPEAGEERRAELVTNLQAGLNQARDLLSALSAEGGEAAVEEVEESAEKKIRYLFPLDVVFQTMYELCTNETVKSHITAAREQAGTIFDQAGFHDQISEKVAGLEVEDNFFSVPLDDILRSLFVTCSDDKVKNLFQRMVKNKESIFLDQSLPLEVPPTEEVEEAKPASPVVAASSPDPRLGEMESLLDANLSMLDELANLPTPTGSVSGISLEDQGEVFGKIEEAFERPNGICGDVSKITESLSFQDISGQQILKIIKLLSDFQAQLLGIVVSFGAQLKHKKENKTLSREETKEMAQEDVDKYMRSMTTDEVGGEGALDQDSVNNLLADMGF